MGNFLSREECAQRRGKVYPQALRLYAIEAKPISGQIGRLRGKVRSGVKQHRQVESGKRPDCLPQKTTTERSAITSLSRTIRVTAVSCPKKGVDYRAVRGRDPRYRNRLVSRARKTTGANCHLQILLTDP
jgi:hypothetical protein